MGAFKGPHGEVHSFGLRDPLQGEFLALLGAGEKIKIQQLLVREAG
jgi:hypothetical protein